MCELALIVVTDGSPGMRGVARASEEKLFDRGCCYAAVSFSDIPRKSGKDRAADERLTPDSDILQ